MDLTRNSDPGTLLVLLAVAGTAASVVGQTVAVVAAELPTPSVVAHKAVVAAAEIAAAVVPRLVFAAASARDTVVAA